MSLASSTATDPSETVFDILDGADASLWTHAAPTVRYLWDVPVSERGPGHDQPAELYVWPSQAGSYSDFSADGDTVEDNYFVQVDVYSLNEAEAIVYRDEARDILEEYNRDNQNRTEWHQIKPSTPDDHRQERPRMKSNHYVTTVECTVDGLRSSGT